MSSSSSGGKTEGRSLTQKSNNGNQDEFINKIGQIRHLLTSPQPRSRSQTSVPRLYTKNTPGSSQYVNERQNASMCNINNNNNNNSHSRQLMESSAEHRESGFHVASTGAMVPVSAEQVNPSFGRNDIKRRPTPSYRNTPLERRRPATTTKELERQEGSHANFERLSELFQGRRYRRRQSESSASGFTNSFSGTNMVSESFTTSITESMDSENYLAYELSSSVNSSNSITAPTSISSIRPVPLKNQQPNMASNPSRPNEQRRHSGVSLKTQKMLSKLCKSKSRESLTAIGKDEDKKTAEFKKALFSANPPLKKQATVAKAAKTEADKGSESSSDDEEECKQSKEKVMKWLSCQSLNTDFGHPTTPGSDLVSPSPKTSFSLQGANKFQFARQDSQSTTTAADQYTQSEMDHQSVTSKRSMTQNEHQPMTAELQLEVPKMEVKPFRSNSNASANNDDNLLKYIQQLQKRFNNLEQETNRVITEFETMNRKWVLDKERLQAADHERMILSERCSFLSRQRDIDKQRLVAATRQYGNMNHVNGSMGVPADMDGAIAQLESLLINLNHENRHRQDDTNGKDSTDGSVPTDDEYMQDLNEELTSTRLTVAMMENRNNFLTQEIASLTIQLKNANRTIDHLRKTRDEQKRSLKQTMEKTYFKPRSETSSQKPNVYEESSAALSQLVCARINKSDLFLKDLEKLLAHSEVANTSSKGIIDAITGLLDGYYETWTSSEDIFNQTVEGKDNRSFSSPIASHRRRMSSIRISGSNKTPTHI